MLRKSLMQSGLTGCARVAALAAVGAALAGWNPVDATAASRLDTPRPIELRNAGVADPDLEQLFWRCDYAATTRLIDANERAGCGAVSEQLKQGKFGGDFEAMLKWWREHKEAEHRKLDQDLEYTAIR